MRNFVLILSLLLLSIAAKSQAFKKEMDSLLRSYSKLTSDRDKIERLSEIINISLADDPKYGDSVAGAILNIAEMSRDRELMCLAYLDLSRQYLNYENLRNNGDVGEQYATKLLALAKSSNLDPYIISGYLALARSARIRFNNQKALEYNNLAISLASNANSDSITCICYVSLANTWMNLNNKLAAFQSRLTARDFAEKSKDPNLLLRTMLDLANFYASVDEFEKAKDLYFASIPIARAHKEWEFTMVAQRALASVYVQTKQNALALQWYDRALHVADSVGKIGYKINVYFDILNYLINNESAEKALVYLGQHEEISKFLLATGEAFEFDKLHGIYHFQKKQYDSADYYFARAMPFIEAGSSPASRFDLFNYMANMYRERGLPNQQFIYLERCRKIADSLSDIDLQSQASLNLDSFYQAKGDFKNAYHYYSVYNHYADSLRKLSEQKDLLALEIDNENKRKIKQQEEHEAATRIRENVEYMGITAAIAAVFILLVVLGAFKISVPLIKGLGFIAFIFLFEFIILLADRPIHHWTDGEPWKLLGLKIVLIAMLYPLHHWLEHGVIKYLVEKDLLKGRSLRLPLRWRKKGDQLVTPVAGPVFPNKP